MAAGHVDVDAMLDLMSPMQWHEWQIFARLRPFGDRRADLRNALLAMVVDAVVCRVAGLESNFDPKLLMPFEKFDEADEDEGGWEDPQITFMKLQIAAQQWDRKLRAEG